MSDRERVAEVVYLELCGPGDTEPMPAMVESAERIVAALLPLLAEAEAKGRAEVHAEIRETNQPAPYGTFMEES